MIDTAAIKNKVLAFAFQGKLVEQTNENAQELLSRVCNERDVLIKQKLIKKSKTKPIADDDKMYQIPANWIWVRLGDVINLQSGQDLATSDYNDQALGVPYITGASNFRSDESLIINRWTETPKAIALENDILLSVKGTVGKLAFLHEDKVHIARQIMGIRPIGLNRKYVKYFVQEQVEELKAISKGLIPGIERDNVLNMLMPLPPLNEQEMIVEKIEEAFAQIDIIDVMQLKYSSDLEVLKSKIIDAGIQGKLTEQLPEDGTAEDLLEQIAEEKKQLVKEKKIKATKAFPEITEDEIPFEIPDNWKWVRIQELIEKDLGGGTPSKAVSEYWDNGNIPWASVKDFSAAEGGYLVDTIDHITQEGLENSSANLADEKSIVICMRMGLGKIARVAKPMAINQDLRAIWLNKAVLEDYFVLFYSTLRIEGRGMTVAGIRKDELMSMVFPLPSISEQKRIVEKIQQVMSSIYC